MSVEFDGTNQQFIDYGLVSALHNIAQKTVMVFFALDTVPSPVELVDKGANLAGSGWFVGHSDTVNVNSFIYVHTWSGANGVWRSDANVATTSVRDFTVTYNRGNTANDPIFYVDGSSVNVNESSNPAGTVDDDSGQDFWVGGVDSGAAPAMDGNMFGLFVWDRLVSAVDIASMSSKRSVTGHGAGLIFSEKFIGAAGLQVYDGTSLSAANKFVDDISGIQGTPTNSPVGRSDTYMSYGR